MIAAVHVDDVQRAVGRRGQVHRPEPLVGRGDELAALVGLLAAQRRAVVGHDDAADQVAGRLGDEHVAVAVPPAAGRRDRPSARPRGERGERPVGAQDAVLIAAVDAGRRPRRPHGVEVAGIERFVAAARSASGAGCARSRASARCPRTAPRSSCCGRSGPPSSWVAPHWPRDSVLPHIERAVLEPQQRGRLPTCRSSCRAPTAARSRCARRWPRPARRSSVTSILACRRSRSPLVSRASQRLRRLRRPARRARAPSARAAARACRGRRSSCPSSRRRRCPRGR